MVLEGLAYEVNESVVDHVTQVDFVDVVLIRVELIEALLLQALLAETLDVLCDEFEGGLVSVHGIFQVVILNSLVLLSEEVTHRLHAHGRLDVLFTYHLLQHLHR